MKILLSSIILLISLQLHAHDIHVSVADLRQDRNLALELTIKIFYDDLLSAIGLVPGEELPEDYTSSDDLIQKYLDQHFQIKINGIQRKFEYIESVSMMPVIWVTLILPKEKYDSVEKIEIVNTIFLDLFNDQTNMVNIEIDKGKKSFVMNGKKNTVTYSIK